MNSNGNEWISRRIDHLEDENQKLSHEIAQLREDHRVFRDTISSNIKSLENLMLDMPEMRKQFYRNRGVSDGIVFIGRTLVAFGAAVSAFYVIWSLFGDVITG